MQASETDVRIQTEIRGAPARLFKGVSGEIVISGPAGTGKTRAILEYFHQRSQKERLRGLILRKTLESLKGSALLTYQDQVLYKFDGKRSVLDGVEYFGGNKIRPADFTYLGTGSKIVLGGMDNTSKVLSTEYDWIYVNECTELTLDEWETLGGRTDRPSIDETRPASLLLGDCNPGPPTHWIKQREADGNLTLWLSVHEDNPAMWDRTANAWTISGLRYLERLNRLTGVRYQRLRLGKWVSAEGVVYEHFDPYVHLVDRFEVPAAWPRYWCIDFGYQHPFVWQWWAESPDGDLYLYREIYMTKRLVEDHARQGLMLSAGEPRPAAIICDHDAEDRATFERHTGYRTKAAHKAVSSGIQDVATRLGKPGDTPRIFFMRDSLVERDRELQEAGHPSSTVDEFPSYVWNTNANRRKGDEPVKENDHGMDTMRYMVAFKDARKGRKLWGAA